MKQIINIDLLKENPELFFSQLPEKAEKEINEFLRFVFFKYEINKKKEKKKKTDLLETFASLRKGLPKDYKFNRDEANER